MTSQIKKTSNPSSHRAMPGLDRYEARGLDDDEISENEDEMLQARRRAEAELDQRDGTRLNATNNQLLYGEDDEDDYNQAAADRAMAFDQGGASLATQAIEHLEDQRGYPLPEWIAKPEVGTEVANRFKHFLKNYVNTDTGDLSSSRKSTK